MKYRKSAAILSFITLFILACQDEIPINELSKAKQAIDKALTVKADEYAPEEFGEANRQIAAAHEVMIKDEKPEESIKNADVAYTKAVEAYNKSAVLYAEAGIRKAEEAIAAADDAYAEKLSADNFREAKDLNAGAAQKYDAREYEESIKLSQAAYDKAVLAKDESLDNKYQLQVKIDEVSSRISRIEQYDYEAYAPGQYNLAVENLKKAQDEYNDDRIKDGFQSVAVADKNADEAYRLTMNGVTSAKIAEAEEAVRAAENSNGASSATEDMDAAREALANAKLSRDNGNYDDSIAYCNEAIRFSNDVIESGKNAAVVASGDGSDTDKDKDKSKGKSARGEVISEDDDYYYYKVKSWAKYGDCLWQIADEYYGNPRLWTRIYKANKKRISNPDLIKPGWVLKIPKIKK
ncbi:MAG TPA: LysM peptidoglycan-binding domain-containing protein [Spirochaetota bacterium]|nr:LysM peptidoglycan-binding domain-containing protein [Spirochaetota bacterium]HQO40986.1 LysM peptidoglycan-binding domain-containing protein [Spirochaetota bacterium]